VVKWTEIKETGYEDAKDKKNKDLQFLDSRSWSWTLRFTFEDRSHWTSDSVGQQFWTVL